jgi:hypothetical protein
MKLKVQTRNLIFLVTNASMCAAAVLVSSLLTGTALADPTPDPRLIAAPVERVFVPLGFDNNDNVEVVIHGHFTNTCFKVGPTNAVIDAQAKTVTIQAQAYEYSGVVCAQVQIPFITNVNLGVMKEGEYSVSVVGLPDLVIDPLTIGVATTANPDDFIYAPVEQASLQKNAQGLDILKIEGVYPFMFTGCMNIKEVKVSLAPGQVIVVQPIADILEDRFCSPQDSKKFTIERTLDFPITFSEYLIHVRTLSGSSVNRFVAFGN